jgi:hypothetical protein
MVETKGLFLHHRKPPTTPVTKPFSCEKETQFNHCTPPDAPDYHDVSIFLGDNIEVGEAVQQQRRMIDCLQPILIAVGNPRR